MLVKDNTIQIVNAVWIMGAMILATMNVLHGNILGFFLWIIFGIVIIILDTLRHHREMKELRWEIRRSKRAIQHIENENEKIEKELKDKINKIKRKKK